MKKLINTKCIFLIGSIAELKLQLLMIEDKSMTLTEYIRSQMTAYKNSLN